MWHRRDDVGTASGTTLGMRFTSDTIKKTLSTNNDVEYYDLIEFSGMSVTPTMPLVVGKIFPQLKIVVIDNEELVAAMSYKSNRNFTLPDLSAELITSVNGKNIALNDVNLLKIIFEIPYMFAKVITLIHWQALKLIIKGNKYIAKPKKKVKNITLSD